MERTDPSRGILIGIGAVVALLVVVAVALALRSEPALDAGTPEATIQGFYLAVADGDRDTAFTYLTPDLAVSCADGWPYEEGTPSRVVVNRSVVDGDSARVDVTVTVRYGADPFGGGGWDMDDRVTLTKDGDTWLIAEPVWPLDEWACGKGDA